MLRKTVETFYPVDSPTANELPIGEKATTPDADGHEIPSLGQPQECPLGAELAEEANTE